MNRFIKYFKNKEKIKDFVTVGLFSFSIKSLGVVVVSSIFINSIINGWFGFNSLASQMGFCGHTIVIIFLAITLILGLIFDRAILKNRYNLLSRKIFWVWLLILVVSYSVGHYKTISAAGGLDASTFDQLKYLICY